MAFKFVALFALVAAASASPIAVDNHYHQSHQIQAAPVLVKTVGPAYHHADAGHHEEHYGPAQYDFSYSVHDEHTGDVKHQKETRHGDQVQGEYSLIEPDGHRRTVKYSSDKHTGFVAEVHREEVHGYKAPVQASYHHGGDSHGHGNVGYVHKVAVAPVQVATISHGHSSGGHGSSYAGHGSSYGSHGHSQIVAAAPVYQKVAIAAPISHGQLSGGYASNTHHGSSSVSYGHNSGAQYASHGGHSQIIAVAPVYHKVAVAPVQHVTVGHASSGHGSAYGHASSGAHYAGHGHTQVVAAAPVYHKVAVAAAPVHHITTSSASHGGAHGGYSNGGYSHGGYSHGGHDGHSATVSFSAPHHSYHY